MEKYIGTKQIEAEPMTRGDYNNYRGWEIPADENPADEGFLVKYSDGYISWSPKKQFEEAYRKSGEMSFGHAIEALKQGKKAKRKGWNGKGMFLFLATGKEFESQNFGDSLPEIVQDVICMKTAQNTICIGWLASQADMLSDDWEVFDR